MRAIVVFWLVTAAGLVGVLCALVLHQAATPIAAPPVATPTVAAVAKPDWRKLAEPHLRWADDEAQARLGPEIAKLDHFFSEARRGSRGYAETMIGWGSKWRFVADQVPWTSGNRQDEFLRAEFERYIYKPQDLDATINELVRDYVRSVESVEGQMLVRLRADLATAAPDEAIAQLDKEQIAATYTALVTKLSAEAGGKVVPELGIDLASIVAGEVLTQIAVQLGVQGGILGTGAASGLATFGVGLVVGVAVDYVVAKAWNWYADPAAELCDKVNAELQRTRELLVEGTPEAPGLRQRLRDFAKQRSKYRTEAVHELLAGR